MIDSALVQKKLALIIQYLDELAPLTAIRLEEYRSDYVTRHAIEKLIELIIEYATDINRLVLLGMGKEPPQTYYNTFAEMARHGVLPAELATRLASTTGLRNRLVHGYDDINHEIVCSSLRPLLRRYRKYVKLIESFLSADEEHRE